MQWLFWEMARVRSCGGDGETLIPCKQINPKSIFHSLEKIDINRVQGGYRYTGNCWPEGLSP